MRTFKRHNLSKFLLIALNILIVFGNQEAAAQPVSLGPPADRPPPPYCQTHMLNGLAFMKSLQTIIAHGDLADVAFIEKILGTSFSSQYFVGWDKKPDPQRLIYQTNKFLGAPINVALDITTSKSERLKYPWTGFMIIGSDYIPGQHNDFVADCAQISVSRFSAYFDSGFTSSGPVNDPLSAENFSQMIPFLNGFVGQQKKLWPGKNGSKLSISFSYRKENNLIYSIEIGQSK